MKKHVKKIITNPLISGSSIIFIGSFVTNIFSYLFNLSMGRMLPAKEYGLLISLTSFLIMLTIFSVAFSNIFAKFSARYEVREEFGKLRHLIITGSKYVFIISSTFLLLLVFLTGIIGDFLHIENNTLVIAIFFAAFLSMFGSIPAGVLQGTMRFYMNSFLGIMQSVIKLVVAVLLVFLGFQVFGAVISILISTAIVVAVGYLIIIKYLRKQKGKNEDISSFRKEFTHYTYTFILASLGITLLGNTDIILVRHFFQETVSGQYAALSLMGKAIFYLLMPINFVFFPLIAQKKERNEKLFSTVLLTSGIVFVSSIAISFVYFTFPGLILKVFFPAPEYQMLKPYLGLFSLYILIFSLVNIMNSFFLSIGKTKVYIFTLVAAIGQIILITFFHNSLYQIIGVLFLVNVLLFISYFIYYMSHGKD